VFKKISGLNNYEIAEKLGDAISSTIKMLSQEFSWIILLDKTYTSSKRDAISCCKAFFPTMFKIENNG